MRCFVLILAAMASLPAFAAPPPPPPDYVWQAAKVLTADKAPEPIQYAPLFAENVVVFENGKTIANGKAAWLDAWAKGVAHYNGRIIGYSQSFGGYSEDGGELLVIDTFDTVDRTNLPPPPAFLADPRMATRSTLYQFGADHLIHYVRIAKAGGFWEAPHP